MRGMSDDLVRETRLPLPPVRTPKWDWRLAFEIFLGLTMVAWILVVLAPKFEEVYRQAKVPMSGSLLTIISLSQTVSEDLWVLAAGMFLMSWDAGRWVGRKASIARVLVPIVTLLIAGWMVCSLFLPLLNLGHDIGPRKH